MILLFEKRQMICCCCHEGSAAHLEGYPLAKKFIQKVKMSVALYLFCVHERHGYILLVVAKLFPEQIEATNIFCVGLIFNAE